MLGANPGADVALVRIRNATGLATVSLGDSDKVAVGDATIAAVAATRYIEELDAGGGPAEAEEVERLYVQA